MKHGVEKLAITERIYKGFAIWFEFLIKIWLNNSWV